MEYILKSYALTKYYKRQAAVDHADMNIARGDIYGFVGENGSGKTTIIRLITGLISPSEGYFELFGIKSTDKNISRARRKIGAIVENPSIYRNMTAYENLKAQSIVLGIKDEQKIIDTLAKVGLSELLESKKKAGNFSLGMRQRLGIAMALLGDPEFLILDEPLNGLDPAGIVEMRELILDLNQNRGITFLISSHILSELSMVATKYGIISKGAVIKEISTDMLHTVCGKSTVIKSDSAEELFRISKDFLSENEIEKIDGGIEISGELKLNPLLSKILSEGIVIQSINSMDSSFEDYYLSVIGGGKR